jgi:hypothetical protein
VTEGDQRGVDAVLQDRGHQIAQLGQAAQAVGVRRHRRLRDQLAVHSTKQMSSRVDSDPSIAF